MPLLEVEGAEPALVELGFEPVVEERLAVQLLGRYQGDEGLRGYCASGEINLVDSEELLRLAGEGPAPSIYLALRGTTETAKASGFAELGTHWRILILQPAAASPRGFGGISRSRLVRRLKILTLGYLAGAIEDDDGELLSIGLVSWDRVDAAKADAGNATLRTLVDFSLTSEIRAATGEPIG